MSGKEVIKTGKEIHDSLRRYDIPNPNPQGWFLTEQRRREQKALENQKWKLVKK